MSPTQNDLTRDRVVVTVLMLITAWDVRRAPSVQWQNNRKVEWREMGQKLVGIQVIQAVTHRRGYRSVPVALTFGPVIRFMIIVTPFLLIPIPTTHELSGPGFQCPIVDAPWPARPTRITTKLKYYVVLCRL